MHVCVAMPVGIARYRRSKLWKSSGMEIKFLINPVCMSQVKAKDRKSYAELRCVSPSSISLASAKSE